MEYGLDLWQWKNIGAMRKLGGECYSPGFLCLVSVSEETNQTKDGSNDQQVKQQPPQAESTAIATTVSSTTAIATTKSHHKKPP